MKHRPKQRTVHICLILLMLSSACVRGPSSPLVQDLRRVQPGMTPEQVEAIMGKYLDQTEGDPGDPRSPTINPMGGINRNDITYPLWDEDESTNSEEQIYRTRTRRGDWEYAFIEFKDGRVTSVRLLR